MVAPPFPWSDDDSYLKPVLLDDPLLQLDLEDEDELREEMESIQIADDSGEDTVEKLRLKQVFCDSNYCGVAVSLLVCILFRLKETELKLVESENRLKDAYEDMSRMR